MKIKLFSIPNLLTASNAVCGMLAVGHALIGDLTFAAWLIILGAIFDVFDGLVARAMKISGPLGKQLDSLADVITFGLAPGAIMYRVLRGLASGQINGSLKGQFENMVNISETGQFNWLIYISLMIPVFALFRLAKFNIDERQSKDFRGLPTPATAIFFLTFPFVIEYGSWVDWINIPVLSVVIVIMSLMMISDIPLFSFKWKGKPMGQYKLQGVFLLLSIIIIAICGPWSIALIVFLYLILSILFYRPKNL